MLKWITAALSGFTGWLAHTPLNTVVAETPWIIPTVQIIHILAVAFTLAAIMIVNLRVFELVEADQPLAAVAARFLPTLPITLSILALTGLILISGEPNRAVFRTVFWLKMALIIAASALAWALNRALTRPGGLMANPVVMKAQAGVSIALWFAVIVAGRWIGYASGWPGSPQ